MSAWNCFLCLLLAAELASAQSREKRVAPVEANQAARFNRADTVGVAVLVGVGKYPRYSGLSELRYPTVDVDSLSATLKSQRYLVLALKDSEATKGAVLNAIRQAGEALAGENLTVIFFFSGHGFAVSGDNYLATLDANSTDLAASGLSVKTVEQALVKTQAARRVMWIDACRDQVGKGVGEARSFANLQAAAGTRLLLSTAAGKVSYEDDELKQGLFSYYLAKGLQGGAAGADGLVTFQDLAFYVTSRVRSRSLEAGHVQVPYEAGEASGDFLLARLAKTAELAPPSPVPAPIADRGLRPGSAKVNPKDGQTYVWIPPGNFDIGCSPGDNECWDNEKPAHKVSIATGFWLGQTPVTQTAFSRVSGTNPSFFQGGNLPVERVNWDQAKRYCEAIGGRLPTEAEWEYAARAGTTTPRYGELDAIAWYASNSGNQTHPVGTKAHNAWNLYDMLGNVWQWTAEWSGENYWPHNGQLRVVRGGCLNNVPRRVRASVRNPIAPGGSQVYGFRCVGE